MVAWLAPAPAPSSSSWNAPKFQQPVGPRRPAAPVEDRQRVRNDAPAQKSEGMPSQLLTIGGLSVLVSLLIRELRSRQNASVASLAALAAALGGLLSRLVPKLLLVLQLSGSKNSIADGQQGRASDAPRDMFGKSGSSESASGKGGGSRPPPIFIGGGNRHGRDYETFENWSKGKGKDFEEKGKGKGKDFENFKGKGKEKGKGKGKGKGKDKEGPRTWFEDEYDDPHFWWRHKKDMFFEIEMTHEEDLAVLANPVYQWWDPVIIAEAENFVAISKPAGMRVTTDENGLWDPCPTNFIHVAHQRFDIGSSDEPNQRGICHRLDSHTSGCQIFGRSFEAFGHFTKENSGHRVQKEYLTLVEGKLGDETTPGTGLIDLPIAKYKDFERRQFGSVICAHQGLPAITKYKALRQWKVPAKGTMAFLGEDRWFTLVHLRILSGRTHQIRIHMAYIGYPVIGDIKHNNTNLEHDSAFLPRIFLHCLKMEFKEFDGSLFVASSELAPDLQAGLLRIQALTKGGEADESITAGDGGTLPGLARILEDSKQDHEVLYPEFPPGTAEAFPTRALQYKCRICSCCEEATCAMIQKKNTVAMTWKLVQRPLGEGEQPFPPPPKANQQKEAGERFWGPGELWCPTGLEDKDQGKGTLVFHSSTV